MHKANDSLTLWVMWWVKRLTLAAAVVCQWGCVNDDGSSRSATEVIDHPWLSLLENIADNVLIPEYQRAAAQAQALAGSAQGVASYCNAIGLAAETEARETAKASWRSAMSAWQRVEVMQVGPLLDNGQALRNRIYSYATTAPLSTCAVDQSVVLAQTEGFDLSLRSNNSKGLDALEYLLFEDSVEHTCPIQITETQTWNDLSAQERRQQRCMYAALVAQDVALATQDLLTAWLPSQNNYRFRFLSPGYRLVESNITALSDALFYIEKETKDLKLGVPTGLNTDCSALVCPEALESARSNASIQNVVDNLKAFKILYTGNGGLGFDDIIVAEGFPEVASNITRLVDDAIVFAESIDEAASAQIAAMLAANDSSECANGAANPDGMGTPSVCRLHGYLKRITDVLRSDFITIVNVDLPDRSQADND